MLARLGLQELAVRIALSKRIPRNAIASIFGVFAFSEPNTPISCGETSSAIISTKLGFEFAWANPTIRRNKKSLFSSMDIYVFNYLISIYKPALQCKTNIIQGAHTVFYKLMSNLKKKHARRKTRMPLSSSIIKNLF